MSLIEGKVFTLVICVIHQAMTLNKDNLHSHLQNNTPSKFSYSHMMSQYIGICGVSHVCNKSLLKSLNVTENGPEHKAVCPQCSCDRNCFNNPKVPCCPDLYFSYGVPNCRSTTFTSTSAVKRHYQVIDYCPQGANTKLSEKCTKNRKPSERIRFPPLANRRLKFLYWNIFCAECHNVSSAQSLYLSFECKSSTDFNYFSSYEEIIEHANKKMCSISFEEDKNYGACNPVSSKDIISSCNVTGTWDAYDFSIDAACKSAFSLTYNSVFKNVFCYMCNAPVRLSQPLQNTCLNNSSPFAQLCKEFPRIKAALPFKNIFCKLCSFSTDRQFSTKIQFMASPYAARIQYLIKLNKELFQTDVGSIRPNLPHEDVRPLDQEKLNIAIKSFAFSGTRFCMQYNLPDELEAVGRSCQCNIECYKDCCIDYALQNPVHICTSIQFPPADVPYGKYRVIDRCVKGNKSMSCKHPNSSTILDSLPITDPKSGVTYLNPLCYICNKNVNALLNESEPWGFNVTCSQFINPDFLSDIQNFVNELKAADCNIQLLPLVNMAQKCDNQDATIRACNTTGLWPSLDKGIKHACEQLNANHLPEIGPTRNSDSVYKNIFCQMCNPVKIEPNISSSCDNTTKHFDQRLATSCEMLPAVPMSSPYKNAFCEKCNGYSSLNEEFVKVPKHGDLVEWGELFDFKPAFGKIIVPTYRTLFSLSSYTQEDEPNISVKTCQSNEYLDRTKNICRTKVCYPGKVLNNDKCVSLLPQTKDLRYNIYFRTKLLTDSLSASVSLVGIVESVLDSVSVMLRNVTKLGNDSINRQKFTINVNENCTSTNFSSLQFDVHIVYHISEMIERVNVEKAIVEFSNSIHNVSINNKMHGFSFSQSSYSEIFSKFPNRCFEIGEQTKINTFREVLVNELLLCQQTSLSQEEYTVNKSSNTLNVRSWNVSLPTDQVLFAENNTARVCIIEFNSSSLLESEKTSPDSDSTFILSLLTLICILISLVCLLITFIIYCAFQSLRTLPGLNNMSLMFSLFCAQLVTILRPVVAGGHQLVVMVMSIVLHFFWLAVFFWLQVCSFHMFRVFTRKTHVIKSEKDTCHAAIRYATYAFGFPGCIVVVHLIVNVILSEGTLTGYENKQGLVNDKIAFIVTVIAPLFLICISNLAFFSATAHQIRNTPHAQKNQRQTVEVWVYVKLFALTGLTWIFQIVDAFLSLSVLSYVVAILNGLQGLFLFLSYVCNTRVWNLCCGKKADAPNLSSASSQFSSLPSSQKSTKF